MAAFHEGLQAGLYRPFYRKILRCLYQLHVHHGHHSIVSWAAVVVSIVMVGWQLPNEIWGVVHRLGPLVGDSAWG
jgi:hypothetical protein